MNSLIAMMGLPRSGKTTRAHQLSETINAPIVSPDAIRLVVHGHRYYAPCEDLVWAQARIMVKALFEAGHTMVIFDATNTCRKNRDGLAKWGRDPDGQTWTVEFEHLETTVEECIERAKQTEMHDLIPVILNKARGYQPLQTYERRYGNNQ